MMIDEIRRGGVNETWGVSKRWSYIGLLHIYGIHSRDVYVRLASSSSKDEAVCFPLLFDGTCG